MAASVDSPCSGLRDKERARVALFSPSCSSPLFSPGSDRRFWSALRTRIDTILEDRCSRGSAVNLGSDSSLLSNDGGAYRAKRMKEDSRLLLRGFDSISHALSLLSNNIENALQGAKNLAEPPTLTEMFLGNLKNSEEKEEEDSESLRTEDEDAKARLKRKFDTVESSENNDHLEANGEIPQYKAKNIAVPLATKATSLSRELKSIKSDLRFMQEKCCLLEEENRRLRDGFSKGIRPEEDDLMRLQMEALLAEKSRLATENANLTRENQCLHQLVEYHQLTSQDHSESYEQVVRGLCLDFSSPPLKSIVEHAENEAHDYEVPRMPSAKFSPDGFLHGEERRSVAETLKRR